MAETRHQGAYPRRATRLVAQGIPEQDILQDYPAQREDIRALWCRCPAQPKKLPLATEASRDRFLLTNPPTRPWNSFACWATMSGRELMPQALDDRVLEYAWQERRILVTNDRDFGDKVYRDGRPHAGILLLRLADDRAATKVRIITALLAAHSDQLAGRFVVVTERSIRIRPSPEA